MATENDIKIVITAEDKASGVLSNVSNKTGDFGSKLANFGKAALAGLTVAGGALVAFGVSSVKAFDEQDKAIKQLEAVLKSTGAAAGVTRQEMIDLSGAFQKTSTFADEVVLSAQNVLLTFTNIKGPMVKDATQAVLDMSTALGQDLKSSAIQVGKALQDPILGVTALRRVGVNFNETQVDMIKKLVESGKTMEAQKYILTELSTEFGGSAAKATETFGGKMAQMNNAIGDLKETIGSTLVEALMPFITQITKWSQSSEAQQQIKAITDALLGLTKVLLAIVKFLFVDLTGALGTVIFKFMQMIDAIKSAIEWISKLMSKIGDFANKYVTSPLSTIGKSFQNLPGNLGIPGFANGGVVPGALGQAQLAVVHGGETVIPNGGSAAGAGMVFNFDLRNATMTDESFIRRIQDAINKSLAISAKTK